MAKVKFVSFDAMLNAAMKICNGFMMLHRFGYSYQDLNDGNFFIDPKTGDVLICDRLYSSITPTTRVTARSLESIGM